MRSLARTPSRETIAVETCPPEHLEKSGCKASSTHPKGYTQCNISAFPTKASYRLVIHLRHDHKERGYMGKASIVRKSNIGIDRKKKKMMITQLEQQQELPICGTCWSCPKRAQCWKSSYMLGHNPPRVRTHCPLGESDWSIEWIIESFMAAYLLRITRTRESRPAHHRILHTGITHVRQ